MNLTSPLQQFHLFPRLPRELRLKIYDCILCMPTARHNVSSKLFPDADIKSNETYPENEHTRHILKMSYLPSTERYISNTPPCPLLSMWSESRIYAQETHHYTPLYFGPRPDPIPIAYATTTLYISSLIPSLSSPLPSSLLYTISTTPSRHKIESLAIDLRVWDTLCEEGLLGVLGKMKGLKEVWLVVEFGRREFGGSVGFLGVPRWRGDLRWIAQMAGEGISKEKVKVKGFGRRARMEGEKGVYEGDVKVRCVLLTRGGEQA